MNYLMKVLILVYRKIIKAIKKKFNYFFFFFFQNKVSKYFINQYLKVTH